jgi:hypothetical protein
MIRVVVPSCMLQMGHTLSQIVTSWFCINIIIHKDLADPVICIMSDRTVVVKGAEPTVNAIMKGKFGLELHAITRCALLHILKFVAQLFIPQGMPFGQLMFISLCISWAYNLYTSLLRIETLQAFHGVAHSYWTRKGPGLIIRIV